MDTEEEGEWAGSSAEPQGPGIGWLDHDHLPKPGERQTAKLKDVSSNLTRPTSIVHQRGAAQPD